MHLVTGSNLFEQWDSKDIIIDSFSPLHRIALPNLKVTDITWSYNIYHDHDEGRFYISGAWLCASKPMIELQRPKEIIENKSVCGVSGNENFILLYEKEIGNIWKLDLECGASTLWNWKKLPLFINSETNECEPKSKMVKLNSSLTKVVSKGTTCLCLTESGSLYEIPQKVDTRQCFGRIIDIDCGYEHNIALTDKGRVYTWGNGRCSYYFFIVDWPLIIVSTGC